MPTIFSTEQMLTQNPIQLRREPCLDRRDGLQFYAVNAQHPQDGRSIEIGKTFLRFYEDQKNLVYPTLDSRIRNIGFGVALYIAAEGCTDTDGHNPVLTADTKFMEDAADHVWQSLIRRGLATGIWHHSDPYRFLRTEQ